MRKVAIVTGGSSGIGRETCAALYRSGAAVYEFSRRDMPQEGVTHMTVDVTDEEGVKAAVQAIIAREGRIDILVNNAGFGISGVIELTENADARRLMEVNLMGAVNAAKAVIPVMRSQGDGKIVNLSSIAGAIALPYQAWYSISKAAVLAFSESLRNEVRQFGIDVCTVLPGDIHTGFTDAREKSEAGNELYGGSLNKSVKGMEKDERNGISPAFAGAFIARIALKKRSKPRYVIGNKYRLFLALADLLPNRTVSWIVGLLYG